MYTPNVRQLENRRLVLNFRPCTQLGGWNEAGLLYSDYLARCRTYFYKLLATYDKPVHLNDVVIVVAHGYVVTNFLSYFLGHPVFEEIPELGVNYARREEREGEEKEGEGREREKTDSAKSPDSLNSISSNSLNSDSPSPSSSSSHWVWALHRDCLGALERDGSDGVLNLDSDIVYYKTNFVSKHDLDTKQQFPAIGFGGLRPVAESEPRPSFKVPLVKATNTNPNPNPLTPAAKDWDPRALRTFQVKKDFALKVMNDEAFKKAFDLHNHPLHPVLPEVSPNLAPTRTNSTVDLLKLRLNEDIFHPFRLKYLLALDILVHYLNSKINSHVSLANLANLANARGSANSSGLDLFHLNRSGLGSPQEDTNMNDVIDRLARVRSLQRKMFSSTPKFGPIAEIQSEKVTQAAKEPARPSHRVDPHKFSLQFDLDESLAREEENANAQSQQSAIPQRNTISGPQPRRLSNSVKFMPSLTTEKLTQLIFYNLASGSSSSGSEDESGDEREREYRWFGENA